MKDVFKRFSVKGGNLPLKDPSMRSKLSSAEMTRVCYFRNDLMEVNEKGKGKEVGVKMCVKF